MDVPQPSPLAGQVILGITDLGTVTATGTITLDLATGGRFRVALTPASGAQTFTFDVTNAPPSGVQDFLLEVIHGNTTDATLAGASGDFDLGGESWPALGANDDELIIVSGYASHSRVYATIKMGFSVA